MGLDVDVKLAENYFNLGVDWIQLGCDYAYMISLLRENISRLNDSYMSK